MPDYVLNVNGARLKLTAPEDENLLSVLRNRLDLTGTKYGCGEGQCRACTVLVDGNPTRSCTMPAAGVANSKITTIEGLTQEVQHGHLTPVQQAFLEEGAFLEKGLLNRRKMAMLDLLGQAFDGSDLRVGDAGGGHGTGAGRIAIDQHGAGAALAFAAAVLGAGEIEAIAQDGKKILVLRGGQFEARAVDVQNVVRHGKLRDERPSNRIAPVVKVSKSRPGTVAGQFEFKPTHHHRPALPSFLPVPLPKLSQVRPTRRLP